MQVNLVTAWIDGSSIYGPSASWSDSLRSFSGGLLTSGSEWNMPKQGGGRNLMWSAADPSTGERGPHGLYGEICYILNFWPAPNTVCKEFILSSTEYLTVGFTWSVAFYKQVRGAGYRRNIHSTDSYCRSLIKGTVHSKTPSNIKWPYLKCSTSNQIVKCNLL